MDIEGKAGKATVFVSAYRPCKNTLGTLTVWNQQVQYIQREHDIEVPDIHELFINNLCVALGSMQDEGYHLVLGMDANNDVQDSTASKKLASMGIQEAVVSNHKNISVSATCARNTQRKPINSI